MPPKKISTRSASKINLITIESVYDKVSSLENIIFALQDDVKKLTKSNNELIKINKKLADLRRSSIPVLTKSSSTATSVTASISNRVNLNKETSVIESIPANSSIALYSAPIPKTKEIESSIRQEYSSSVSVDLMERKSLERNLVITGIPSSTDVNEIGLIIKIGKELKFPINKEDLAYAHSSNTKDGNQKQIFVQFHDIYKRNGFFQAYITKKSLSQKDIFKNSVPKRIFVNEQLTKYNYLILKKAASLQNSGRIAKYFSKSGIVCIVEDIGSRYRKITTL